MIFVTLNLVPETYGQNSYGYNSYVASLGSISSTSSLTYVAPTPPALDPVLINIANLDGINTLNCVAGTCYVNVGMQAWHVQHTKEQVIEKINAAIVAATAPPAA